MLIFKLSEYLGIKLFLQGRKIYEEAWLLTMVET